MARLTSESLSMCVSRSNLFVLVQTVWAWLRRSDWKIWPLAFRLSTSPKVIGTDTDQLATYDFLLAIHSNHEPILYPFRDKRRLRSKAQNFPISVYLTPTLGVSSWNFSTAGSEKLEWCPYQKPEIVWRYVYSYRYNTTMWRTGWQKR